MKNLSITQIEPGPYTLVFFLALDYYHDIFMNICTVAEAMQVFNNHEENVIYKHAVRACHFLHYECEKINGLTKLFNN